MPGGWLEVALELSDELGPPKGLGLRRDGAEGEAARGLRHGGSFSGWPRGVAGRGE